jgi:manganese/zinc/iron transport system ATP- binding protein
MLKELMLHIKISDSILHDRLRWQVDAKLDLGVCHHVLGPNGAGKTTFLEELKLHWKTLFPTTLLGFCDQAPLAPFQDLTVESVMNLVWDITADRHETKTWQELACWQDVAALKLLPRLVSQLSGGENQWVKILMMRSLKSDVWMMDEPFQSLDHHRQESLWVLLQEWVTIGKTLILVHHGEIKISPKKSWQLDCAQDGVQLKELL